MDKRPIPKNLDECFEQLKDLIDPFEIRQFQEGDGEYAHFGIGMSLRNAWGLWSGSPLKDYFRSLGIEHGDDMSGIIMEQFYRHLRGLIPTTEAQVQRYREHWERTTGEQPPRLPDKNYVTEW